MNKQTIVERATPSSQRLILASFALAALGGWAACGSGGDTSGATGSSGTGGASSTTTGTGGTSTSSGTTTSTATSTGTTGTSSSTATGTASSSGTGGGMPAGCRTAMDCQAGDFCSAFNLPPFCNGQCDDNSNGDCQTDVDCVNSGKGFICDLPCKCPKGGAQPVPHCTKGCTLDPDCGPSQACNAMHRCEGALCATSIDCTGNFVCDKKHCAAKSCAKDADCADYCVNNTCSPNLGACAPAVP